MSDNSAPVPAADSSALPMLTTDWDTLIANSRQTRDGQFPDTLTDTRADLLNKLRLLGADRFEASYDGYGDSGEIESLTALAGETTLTLPEKLANDLDDFVWRVAYSLHPGFENNEGGCGTLEWDVVADQIDLSHSDRYVATEDSSHSF